MPFCCISSVDAYIIKIQIVPIFGPVDIQHRGIGLHRADDDSLHPSRQVCLAGHSGHTCRVCVGIRGRQMNTKELQKGLAENAKKKKTLSSDEVTQE